MNALPFTDVVQLTGGKFGHFDVACPVCGPERRSPINRRRPVLRLWCDDPDFATYSCARCGLKGWSRRTGERSSIDRTELELRKAQAVKRERDDEKARTERGLALWNEARLTDDTVVAIYLASRGVAAPGSEVLRFHPDCPFGLERHPCMFALLRNIITNKPQAIQRTALTATGAKIDRMTLGPKAGAAIKITPDDMVEQGLTIGEGLETTLAGMQLGFRPAWALGDANEIAKFPVLAGIDALTILVDNDESGTGQAAAIQCSRRWALAGREVLTAYPSIQGDDIADIIEKGAA